MCDDLTCGTNHKLPPIALDSEKRRLFLKGAISLPLATVLGVPGLAQAASKKLQTVSLDTDQGSVSAALALPKQVSGAASVLLIHEWWGLNDQIKAVAQDFADRGYIALAVDLYGGNNATSADQARSLMSQVDAAQAQNTLQSWVGYLQAYGGENRKVATVGWCFGGGWSLNTALTSNIDAAVIYYGNVAKSAEQLASLNCPIQGHFATEDQWINKPMVDGFSAALAEVGKSNLAELYWYEAQHAFANPTSARYDQQDAALAWQRTQDFLQLHL